MPDVSVLICTRNRASQLASVLQDLGSVERPPGRTWELVVVDNGSVDDTPRVIAEAAAGFPVPLRGVREERRGKSHALNTGVAAAGGEVIILTDDDVEIAPGWLRAICEPFDDPECGGVVGRVLPRFTVPVPGWLPVEGPRRITAALLTLDLGEEAVESPVPPFGANMGFRRALLDRIGGFDVGLGGGSSISLGDDTEFWYRARAAGARFMYAPNATVVHPIGPDRLNRRYLARWYREAGRAQAAFARPSGGARTWWGVPRYRYRECLSHLVGGVTARTSADRFHHRLQVHYFLGTLEELFRPRYRSASGPSPSESQR